MLLSGSAIFILPVQPFFAERERLINFNEE